MDSQINNTLIEFNHQQYKEVGEGYKQQLANQWFEHVKAVDPNDFDRIHQLKEAVYQFGKKQQHDFWTFNTGLKGILDRQIRDAKELQKSTELLQDLQLCVLKTKPPKNTFLQGFMNMFKLLFSDKESAWEMWLESYPTYKEKITAITAQLESKKDKLKRDNSILGKDKGILNNHILALENSFDAMSYLEEQSDLAIMSNTELSPDQQQFLVDDLVPIKKQRIIELQQQLLIARQAAMTLDLFIGQNESQIRGIDQAIYTTTSAMEVTASIFVLKQSELTINQSNTLNSQKLKQARHMVDTALKELEQTKIESSTIHYPENSNDPSN